MARSAAWGRVMCMLPERARCLDCRYALAGVAARLCPECGRAFDPGDRLSFSVPGDAAEWHRRALRAPGWIINGQGAAACAMLILAFSPPAGYHGWLAFWGGLLFVTMMIAWLVWAGNAIQAARANRGFTEHIKPRLRRWLFLPAAFGLTFVLITSGVPRQARFAVARASLETTARGMQAPGAPWLVFPASAPTFKIRRVEAIYGVVLVHLDGPGFLEHPVLVYVPGGLSPAVIPPDTKRVRHFTGMWYVGWEEY